jgi:hypothetical protein
MGRNNMQSMNLGEGGMNADVLNRLLGAMGGGMPSMNLGGGVGMKI